MKHNDNFYIFLFMFVFVIFIIISFEHLIVGLLLEFIWCSVGMFVIAAAEDGMEILGKKHEKKQQKKFEEQVIKEKSREIWEQTRYIENDIQKYNKLNETIPYNREEVRSCLAVSDLIEKLDKSETNQIKPVVQQYMNLYEEKQKALDKIEKVAFQYNQIGNTQAAEQLLSRIRR